jgi:hypothetical protein
MSNIDKAWFDSHLSDLTAKDRDVHLYDVNGQTLFPLFRAGGSLTTHVACYLILRGTTERVPIYDGDFPSADREIVEIGNGWMLMCVVFQYHLTAQEKVAKLKEAEKKLLTMKHSRGNYAT